MTSWLGRALFALMLAASCAKATEERILTDDDDDEDGGAGGSAGTSTNPFGGSSGVAGSSSGAGGRGGAGGTPTGGKGGAGGASGSGGSGGSDMGGASDGGEGGADPCVVSMPPSRPRVDYKQGARALTDDPGGEIQLRNASTTSIPLSELTLRYWFTSEFSCAQTTDAFTVYIDDFRFQNPHVEKMKTDVTIDVVALGTVGSGCDAYFELGFTAATGLLDPGQFAAISYHTQLNDYTRPHSQANDYSYGACTSTHVYWEKITVYRDGRLITGTPPGGGGGEGGAGGESSGGMGGV